MSKRTFRICLTGLVGLLGSACDTGQEGSEIERACQRSCAKLELCDDGTDVLDCETRCQAQTVRSGSYQEVRARCIDDLSCNHLLAGLDSTTASSCPDGCALEDCIGDALAGLGPSEEQTAACERTSSKLSACDAALDADALTGSCLELVPAISSDYLEASDDCVSQPCAGIGDCLAKTADRFDTELRIDDGLMN